MCKNPACEAIFTTDETVNKVLRHLAKPEEVRALVSALSRMPPEQLTAVKQLVAGL